MSAETLFDALELSLQAIEQGADIESCLVRFPEVAADLHPLLLAAVQARAMISPTIPVEVARRGKARLLQAAAEMREQRAAVVVTPSFWSGRGIFGSRFIRLALTTSAMIIFLLTGGTGLVNASSNAIPGDQLYSVKRSWEGVRLLLVLDNTARVELEHQFDHERMQEIEELYTEKRVEAVNFKGVIQSQQNGIIVVDGINVALHDKTRGNKEIQIGSVVQIYGETEDGIIEANQLYLIATPGVTPTVTPVKTATPTPSEIIPGSDNDESQNSTGEASSGGAQEDNNDGYNPTQKPGSEEGHHTDPSQTPGPDHHESDDEHHGGDDHHPSGTMRPRTPSPTESSEMDH